MKTLIAQITRGDLSEGQTLPSEKKLVERFGVSRATVRECLRALEERGLIEVRHGRAAIVAPCAEWNTFDAEVLEGLLSGRRAAAVRDELVECRRALETEAADLAARKATRAQVGVLRDTVIALRESAEEFRRDGGAQDRFLEADVAFHQAVVATSGNRSLGRLVDLISTSMAAAPLVVHTAKSMETAVSDHMRIAAAIARAEPELARAAMYDHLAPYEDIEHDGNGGESGFAVA